MAESNATKLGVIGFLTGSVAGLTAGLLLAPKSGRETRQDLQRKTKDGFHRAQEKLEQGKDMVGTKLTNAINTTKTVVDESKKAASDAKDRIGEKTARN